MSTRSRAAIVAVAPAVLLAALVWHPYLPGRQPNVEALATAVAADPTRWGLSHLAISVASGLTAVAFLAIRSYLREAGEDRWSILGLPFIVIGSTLFTILPGMEFAPLAAAKTGGDVQGAQAALQPWFVPILGAGALTFALGVLGFAKGIARSEVLSRQPTWLVVAALVIMAVSRFVPLAVVQLYVQGAAGIAALWPLAYRMGKHRVRGPAAQPRPAPAT
jgi:hypothetical protein